MTEKTFTRRTFLKGTAAASVLTGVAGQVAWALGDSSGQFGPAPEMLTIPAGNALLGTSQAEMHYFSDKFRVPDVWFKADTPRRVVEMSSFNISRHPVTVGQFVKFCWDTDYPWPHLTRISQLPVNLPVTMVNLQDVQSFLDWCGMRLPTTDEWEYAARGEEGLLYPWGNSWDARRLSYAPARNEKKAFPVDAHPEGASPFGVLDMSGNVCEWTGSACGKSVVVKGGYWKQDNPFFHRPASRIMSQPGDHGVYYIGFRCAQDV